LIYSIPRVDADKQQAELLADEHSPVMNQSSSYHENVIPHEGHVRHADAECEGPIWEKLWRYAGPLESEKKERAQFSDLFFEGKNRYSNN